MARPAVILALVGLGGLLTASSLAPREQSAERAEIEAFIARYCLECHSGAEAQADIDLEGTQLLKDPLGLDLWERVFEVLDYEEMPPRKARRQPETQERDRIKDLLGALLGSEQEARTEGGRTVLRRLNSQEFTHAVQDLFGMPLSTELRGRLPEDEEERGFTVIGENLRTTASRLDVLVEAAWEIGEGVGRALELPEVHTRWDLRGTNLAVHSLLPVGERSEAMEAILALHAEDKRLEREDLQRPPVQRNPKLNGRKLDYVGVRPARYQFEGDDLAILRTANRHAAVRPPAAECGTPNVELGGRYRYRVTAGTIRDPESRLTLRVGIRAERSNLDRDSLGGVRTLRMARPNPIETPLVLEGTAWMRPGERLVVQAIGEGIGRGLREEDVPRARTPGLVVRSIELEAATQPEHQERRKQWFGAATKDPTTRQVVLAELLQAALGSPVDAATLSSFDAAYPQAAVERGEIGHVEAMTDLLALLFASPRFLYVEESTGKLDAYRLARRLALMLWRSLPDRELYESAATGALTDGDELWRQAERMLADPRSERFRLEFLEQWLDLDKFGTMIPDSHLYPEWSPLLERSLREQTIGFFRKALEENLPLTDFLASDWTLLDARLGRLYAIPQARGVDLEPIALEASQRERGGLLGMGSILNLTTNGTVTSPVLRGVWVIERMLGRHPAPPPPDIPSIEPDIRGTTTILEQLEKHSSLESCAGCHRKMDPFGIPLEAYDVLGAHRERYRGVRMEKVDEEGRERPVRFDRADVSTATTLPDGTEVESLADIQAWLLENPELFAHGLAEKLLVFGTGRILGVADQDDVEAILERAGGPTAGLSDLLEAVLRSELFRTNGAS